MLENCHPSSRELFQFYKAGLTKSEDCSIIEEEDGFQIDEADILENEEEGLETRTVNIINYSSVNRARVYCVHCSVFERTMFVCSLYSLWLDSLSKYGVDLYCISVRNRNMDWRRIRSDSDLFFHLN